MQPGEGREESIAGKEAKAEWLWGRRHSANSQGTKGEGKGPGCYCRMGSL